MCLNPERLHNLVNHIIKTKKRGKVLTTKPSDFLPGIPNQIHLRDKNKYKKGQPKRFSYSNTMILGHHESFKIAQDKKMNAVQIQSPA